MENKEKIDFNRQSTIDFSKMAALMFEEFSDIITPEVRDFLATVRDGKFFGDSKTQISVGSGL